MPLLSLAIYFYGCGDHNGSSEQIENNNFKLFPDAYFTPDYHETSDLSVGGFGGLDIKAFYTIDINDDFYEIDGERAVTVYESIITLGNAETWLLPSKYRTIFFTNSATDRRMLAHNTSPPYGYGTTTPCTAAGTLPLMAAKGDSGSIAAFAYGDGTMENISWRVSDAGDDLAFLIWSARTTDQNSNLLYSEEYKFLIDHDGNRRSITIVRYDALDDFTTTLSGDMTY